MAKQMYMTKSYDHNNEKKYLELFSHIVTEVET